MRFFRLDTPAAVEPVSIDSVKLHARIGHSEEDSLISLWIRAAREAAESHQNRSYITQTYRMVYDNFPGACIEFPQPPLLSVDSVKYYDFEDTETVMSPSLYSVDTISEIGRLALNYGESWPSVTLRTLNPIIIEFTAGYGPDGSDVPDSVKNAIYLYCTYMYENREAEGNTTIPKAFYDLLGPKRMVFY